MPVIEGLNFILLYTCKFRVGSDPGTSFSACINVETRDSVLLLWKKILLY